MYILVGIFFIYMGCQVTWVGIKDIIDVMNGVTELYLPGILFQTIPGLLLITLGAALILSVILSTTRRLSIINNCTDVYTGKIDEWDVESADVEHGRKRVTRASIIVRFDRHGEDTLCKFDAPIPIEAMYPVGAKVKVYERDGKFAWDRKVIER